MVSARGADSVGIYKSTLRSVMGTNKEEKVGMDLLVQKPQFDTNVLQPGKAVHIKDVTEALGAYQQLGYDTNLRDIDTDAIVTKVEPLSISVYYLGAKKGADYVKIPVELVANKKVEIKLMEVSTNGNK